MVVKSGSFFTFSYSLFLCLTLFWTFSLPCGNGFSQNGGWSPWSKLQTPCQINKDTEDLVECGGGVRVRYRSCSMPVPQGPLGQPCQGDDFKYEACNTHSCLLPDQYMWSSWSSCSKVCGRGISQRHTMCGNIRYKHYESKEKDTTDNSNEETTEGSDVTDTTTDEIPTTNVDEEPISTTEGSDVTDTTTDKILTTNINEEPISTTSNPHQNFNDMVSELEYQENCQSNQYSEKTRECNSWDREKCPSPCERVKCPAFAKCQDVSNETDPLYECICQLGTIKKEDGSSCIGPTPSPATRRPPPTLPPSQKSTATVLTRGASLLLIVFLLVTLILFALAGIWDNSRLIHFNMEFALLLAHFCLLPVGFNEPSICKLISISLHFFFLVCFTFMFLESLHLYSLVGWVVRSDGLLSAWQNMLFGWLIPLVIVMFNLCFEYENYGGDYHCWLQMDTNLIYGQFVPIAFMTIISLAIIEAAGEGAGSKKLQNVNEQQRKTAKIMQRTLVLILPTVFASFLLGTLAEYDQNLILYSIFTLVNGLLGGMIFFFHCTANEKMRKKLLAIKKKIFGPKSPEKASKDLKN